MKRNRERIDTMIDARVWMQLAFIRAGKPNENTYIGPFKGTYREICLNQHAQQ
jgi:hypothetical protein